jgi:hypothetical protein
MGEKMAIFKENAPPASNRHGIGMHQSAFLSGYVDFHEKIYR